NLLDFWSSAGCRKRLGNFLPYTCDCRLVRRLVACVLWHQAASKRRCAILPRRGRHAQAASRGENAMATFHVMAGADSHLVRPAIRKIGIPDVADALKLGWDDFSRKPSHYVFLCLMYPVAGFFLAAWSAGADMLPLIFPLITGFAL